MAKPQIIALDTDDVLVHITTNWIERAAKRPALFKALSSMAQELGTTLTTVLNNRSEPYIQQWLANHYAFPEELQAELDLAYRSDFTFYDDLQPTVFCKSILSALSLPGQIAEIHIVTHNYDNEDPSAISKDRWLRNVFSTTNRVTIHHVNNGEKKSEVMAKHCPGVDMFADDSLKNVVDVLLNDNIRPAEILIPRLGHNKFLTAEMATLAKLRRIDIQWYENVM